MYICINLIQGEGNQVEGSVSNASVRLFDMFFVGFRRYIPRYPLLHVHIFFCIIMHVFIS